MNVNKINDIETVKAASDLFQLTREWDFTFKHLLVMFWFWLLNSKIHDFYLIFKSLHSKFGDLKLCTFLTKRISKEDEIFIWTRVQN